MYNSKEVKETIFKKHGKSEKDTGSTEGQIAFSPTVLNTYQNTLKAIVKILIQNVPCSFGR